MKTETDSITQESNAANSLVRPRYWVCVIGPIPHDALPDGADFPPRLAARRAVEEISGCETRGITNSGWRYEADYIRIMDALYGPNGR